MISRSEFVEKAKIGFMTLTMLENNALVRFWIVRDLRGERRYYLLEDCEVTAMLTEFCDGKRNFVQAFEAARKEYYRSRDQAWGGSCAGPNSESLEEGKNLDA